MPRGRPLLCWFRSPARTSVRVPRDSFIREARASYSPHARTHTRGPTIIRDDHHRATGQEVTTVAHISARESRQKVRIRGSPDRKRPRVSLARKDDSFLRSQRDFVQRRWSNRAVQGQGKREMEFRFSLLVLKEYSIVSCSTRMYELQKHFTNFKKF